jgi:cytoskeleton protein RodZ
MKTVGKQLQEARLAKNWTPELAARETKIKIERLRDLEADDYSHFTSPTYARGFVRTYARSLGLDEYRILRQLDNKLPDDDTSNIATEGGVAYLPETSLPPRAAHRDYTGLYIVMGLGAVVTLAIVFVLFEAYRVGELSNWFASNTETVAAPAKSSTNAAVTPASPTADTTSRALPVDSNTPPPIADATTNAPTPATNAVAETTAPAPVSPRALPVDPSALAAAATDTNSAPSPAPVQPPRALPVDPSELTNAVPTTPGPDTTVGAASGAGLTNVAPRALPVDPSELVVNPADPAPTVVAENTATNGADVSNGTNAISTPAVTPAVTPVAPVPTSSARGSDSSPVMVPSLPTVVPAAATAPAVPEAATNAAPQTPAAANADQPLILTASQDSFVRVTDLDSPDGDKPLYAAVLHSGETVAFSGHRFSINVGVPSAVDIKLDGVNYGPHSDNTTPETFTVQSHVQ